MLIPQCKNCIHWKLCSKDSGVCNGLATGEYLAIRNMDAMDDDVITTGDFCCNQWKGIHEQEISE